MILTVALAWRNRTLIQYLLYVMIIFPCGFLSEYGIIPSLSESMQDLAKAITGITNKI